MSTEYVDYMRQLTQFFVCLQGYGVLMGNALRVSAVDGAADFILFLGKVTVMTATTAIGVFWFKVS